MPKTFLSNPSLHIYLLVYLLTEYHILLRNASYYLSKMYYDHFHVEIKGIVHPKNENHILTLMSFQICMTLIILRNTKYNNIL